MAQRWNPTKTLLRAHGDCLHAQQGGRCAYCGSRVALPSASATTARHLRADGPTIDHVVPTTRGVTDDPENLALSCRVCNSEKKALDLSSFRLFARPQGQRPQREAGVRQSGRDKA